MKDWKDAGAQVQTLLGASGALLVLGIMMIIAIALPVQNWRTVAGLGFLGLLGGGCVARYATQRARQLGVELEPASGEWPSRWTILRAMGWLFAAASVLIALGLLVAGPHVIPRR